MSRYAFSGVFAPESFIYSGFSGVFRIDEESEETRLITDYDDIPRVRETNQADWYIYATRTDLYSARIENEGVVETHHLFKAPTMVRDFFLFGDDIWVRTLRSGLVRLQLDEKMTSALFREVYDERRGLTGADVQTTLIKSGDSILMIEAGQAKWLDTASRTFREITLERGLQVQAAAPAAEPDCFFAVLSQPREPRSRTHTIVKLTPSQEGAGNWKVTPLAISALDSIGAIRAIAMNEEGELRRLWIGGTSGLLMTYPGELQAVPAPPKVHFQEILHDEENLLGYALTGAPHRFSYGDGNLSFEYGYPRTSPSIPYRYEIMIEGLDADWRSPVDRNIW